jgi:DNA-binding LacI/PurR family transcriptional regulator
VISMKQIARLCGVSEAAVSYALRGKPKVNPRTRDRILAVAEKHHYRPNALVRSIQNKCSMTIGVAFNDFGNEYVGYILRGIMEVLHSRRYQVLIIHWETVAGEGPHILREMAERRVDGILMFPHEGTDPRTYLAEMRVFHAPMVLLDRKWPRCRYDMVGSDDRQGGFDLTAHLIALGHRKIANLHNTAQSRSEGFRLAMRKYGVPIREEWVVQSPFEADMCRWTRQWLSAADRPTAIMGFNDEAAMTIFSTAYDLGLRVPQDLSITGFGDLLVGRNLRPRLTTVRQNPMQIGRRAAQLLLQRIEQHPGRDTNMPDEPEHILLPTEMVVRETTAPIRKD